MDEGKLPLSEEERLPYLQWQKKSSPDRLRKWSLMLFTHLAVALFVWQATVFIPRLKDGGASRSNDPSDLYYSPARSAVHYSIVTPAADAWENSEYFTTPSHELDARWAQMFHTRGVYFTKEEVAAANMSSLPLKNGRQATVLGVYHNLHCLRTLYQTVHSDYYYPETGDYIPEDRKEHAHHCLEALRGSVMCNPDLTSYKVFWEDPEAQETTANADSPQVCADWKSIADWINSRRFSHNELVEMSGLA